MPRPHDGHLLLGSWSALAIGPPLPQGETCLLSKAMSHGAESPRALVRCLSFGTSERSSSSDPVCQVHLKIQTAAFSFQIQILKFKGPQIPGESPGVSHHPDIQQWASRC